MCKWGATAARCTHICAVSLRWGWGVGWLSVWEGFNYTAKLQGSGLTFWKLLLTVHGQHAGLCDLLLFARQGPGMALLSPQQRAGKEGNWAQGSTCPASQSNYQAIWHSDAHWQCGLLHCLHLCRAKVCQI